MTSTPNPTTTSSSTSLLPPEPSTTTTSTSPPAFEFPREYHFPPFFTRQANLITRHSQLEKWSALILAYCRHHRIYKLSLSQSGVGGGGGIGGGITPQQQQQQQQHGELFHNRRLNRRLGAADAREIVDYMRKEGRAEYVNGGGGSGSGGGGLGGIVGGMTGVGGGGGGGEDGGTGGGGGGSGSGVGAGAGDVVWVYWKTPEEWAGLIEAWVEETAQKNTVLTLYELTEGEDTRGTEFYGLDPDILQKALQVLVKRGKAQIFGHEDQQGVKFF
ncbi:ESCRT-II complex, vps25 subunit [Biscogniauxia mediterranea]|nr:ESCRT-II complex, vps25 subunit [Biscogniauxia mediterranea]